MKISKGLRDSMVLQFRKTAKRYWQAWNPDIPKVAVMVEATKLALSTDEVESLKAEFVALNQKLQKGGKLARDLRRVLEQDPSDMARWRSESAKVIASEEITKQFRYTPQVPIENFVLQHVFTEVHITPDNPLYGECLAYMLEHARIAKAIDDLEVAFTKMLSHAPSVEAVLAYDPSFIRFYPQEIRDKFANWRPTGRTKTLYADVIADWEKVKDRYVDCLFFPELDSLSEYELR